MKISKNGLDLIMQLEGFMARMYFCDAGKPTIGYGHKILPDEMFLKTAVLSKNEALEVLIADLKFRFEPAINKLIAVQINQNQYDAICCFVFNIGVEAFKNSTMLKLINASDFKRASDQFLKWIYITNPKTSEKEVNSGLKNRRIKEQNLFIAKDDK